MYTDAVDLRDFYATGLGQVARRAIRRRIRALWPDVRGSVVLGLGYATPFLGPLMAEAERVVALMPAGQGVIRWPAGEPGRVALVDDGELPLQDVSVDRVLLVHSLESSEQVRALLAEVWRVLAGSGRLIVVAPNRRGIWSHHARTPFGSGHPYSPPQLSRLLRDSLFDPVRSTGALFVPPFRSPMLLRASPAFEKIGLRWFQTFAGVIVVEATKQIYARPRLRRPVAASARPSLLPLPERPAPTGTARCPAP